MKVLGLFDGISTAGITMISIGIDPGTKGGIAVCDGRDSTVFDIPNFKDDKGKTHVDAIKFHTMIASFYPDKIYIEKVFGANIGGKQSASAAFTFGRSYGIIEACCKIVTPNTYDVGIQKWQRHYGLWGKPKKESLYLARKAFPKAELHLVKHLDRAEALLILHYGMGYIHG